MRLVPQVDSARVVEHLRLVRQPRRRRRRADRLLRRRGEALVAHLEVALRARRARRAPWPPRPPCATGTQIPPRRADAPTFASRRPPAWPGTTWPRRARRGRDARSGPPGRAAPAAPGAACRGASCHPSAACRARRRTSRRPRAIAAPVVIPVVSRRATSSGEIPSSRSRGSRRRSSTNAAGSTVPRCRCASWGTTYDSSGIASSARAVEDHAQQRRARAAHPEDEQRRALTAASCTTTVALSAWPSGVRTNSVYVPGSSGAVRRRSGPDRDRRPAAEAPAVARHVGGDPDREATAGHHLHAVSPERDEAHHDRHAPGRPRPVPGQVDRAHRDLDDPLTQRGPRPVAVPFQLPDASLEQARRPGGARRRAGRAPRARSSRSGR